MKSQKTNIKRGKNVLIVTYYWPPSGGAGVQRFLKFAKYLPQFGIKPYVLTCSNPTYPLLDPTLQEEVGPETSVFKVRSLEPFSMYSRLTGTPLEQAANPTIVLGERELSFPQRLSRWIRANLFIPDARIGWVPFARKKANELVSTHQIDAIITTGPPHSSHFIGSWVKRKTGIPWIADFRDPWTDIHYNRALPRTSITQAFDRRLEKRILKRADYVTVTAQGTAACLSRHVQRDYQVITNGYDPDDFSTNDAGTEPESYPSESIPPESAQAESTPAGLSSTKSSNSESSTQESTRPELSQPDSTRLLIRHVGSITETSVPVNLLKTVSTLKNKPIRLEFIGPTHPAVKRHIESLNIGEFVTLHPYVAHKKAVRLMQQADVNVVVVHRSADSRILIPGKLFDYLYAGKPVMVIGPVDGNAAEIVGQCKSGKCFDYEDVSGPESWLRSLLELKSETGDVRVRFQPDHRAIEQYSRLATTGRLAELVHSLTAGG